MKTMTIPPRMILAGFAPVDAPKRRRTAMLWPKSTARPGSIPALPDNELAWLASDLGTLERRAMRQLCATADLYDVDGVPMIIAPATAELLDTLAAFEVEAEDREKDLCDERDEGEEDDSASDREEVNEDGVNESFDGMMEVSEPIKGAKKPYEAFVADPERRALRPSAWRETMIALQRRFPQCSFIFGRGWHRGRAIGDWR